MSGNYSPMGDRTGPEAQHALPSQVQTSGIVIGGHGSPEGAVQSMPGQVYEDNDTGNLWMKIAGTGTAGWKQIGVKAS